MIDLMQANIGMSVLGFIILAVLGVIVNVFAKKKNNNGVL